MHDPLVRVLTSLFDSAFGPARVLAERDGTRRQVTQWMTVHGVGLRHRPDIIISGLHGPGSFTLIDVKTLDVCGPTHMHSHQSHRVRLAPHAAVERATATDYGTLGPRLRLVPFVVSTFGSFGAAARAFLSGLSRQQSTVPAVPFMSMRAWAAPRFVPFLRMAAGFSVRRSVAAYHRVHWRRWPQAAA